jgi:carboxypeptidase Taq
MSGQPIYAENEATGVVSYDRLMQRFATMNTLAELGSVASTDMNIHMPAASGFAREKQLGALDSHLHELITGDDIRKNLEQAEARCHELSENHQRNLALMRREYDLAASLPPELVREKSELSARGEQMHQQWKKDSDFDTARPHLERLVALSRREGEIYQELFGAQSPYDGLLQEAEPGLGEAKVDSDFADIEDFLDGALPEIMEKQARQQAPIAPAPIHDRAAYERANTEICAALGLNTDQARILINDGHPFSGGTPDDVRLTTALWPDDPIQTIFATMHETGHAMYDQNLPLNWRNQPLGDSLGMGMHESQSLFFENQIGRSYAFLQWLAPKLREHFGLAADDPAWQADNLFKWCNCVQPILTRVFADEATYPLHVITRHKLGKALINGDMQVKDLPEAWNEDYRQKQGIVPRNDGEGVLQDPHWYCGEFSYFHLYSYGALVAAQLDSAMRRNLPDLDMHLQGGDARPALYWLNKTVHSQGRKEDINDLVRNATGEDVGTGAFKQHIRDRYLSPA